MKKSAYFHIKSTCPVDNKECWISPLESEDPDAPYRICRHGVWNPNSETPKCNKEIFRKHKTTKSKTKRKKKGCGCK